MSEQNLEWVRDSYAERDQLGAFAARAAPDVEVDLSAAYPDRPILIGMQEPRGFRDSSWGESQRFEPERYFDVDDERVLAFVRASATGETSGAQVEARPAHVFTFRDGLLVSFKVYLDRSEALDALGLRE